MKSNLITKAVRYALVAGAATALAAPAVFAQNATQSTTNQNQNNTAQLGKIEVTGTRIKRTNVETAQPITIITAAQIKATGLNSIGDVLQQITSAGASFNTQFNNGGTGATYIDLRNLGSIRVLVLLNGQRVDAGVAGSVDLNNIPLSVVDHIEVLQDGASAIYGSDAISGVVNIITIKNYNGAEANAYVGMFDGHPDGGGWDGKTQEYDFTIGSSGDRSGVVMNAEYVNQSPMFAGNRTISKEPVIGGGVSSGSSGTPSGRFFIGIPAGTNCPAGVTTNRNPFSTTCDMTLITTPDNNPSLSNFRDWQNSDHYNFAPLNYLVSPSERTSLFVQGHYDITDNLTFNTMAIYNDRVSQQQLAPTPLFLGRSGTNTLNGQPIVISGKNPYNPFGVDLTGGSTGTASTCAARDNCDVLQFLGRRSVEFGNRVFNNKVQSFAFRGGFTGYFNMLGSEWDWDAGYNYGNNYGSNLEVTNGGNVSGVLNSQNLQNALGYPGEAPCQISPTNTGLIAGCVPLNIFGGLGSITPAMTNYILFEEHDITSETMRDYTANITGNLFNLPAGPVGVAVGAESLEHDAFEHPDSLVASGNSSGSKTASTDGRENTKAEYVEFNIPLVADAPFMKSVSLDIANRWSQFNWKGGQAGVPGAGVQHSADNTSGRAALRWQASDELLLRGSWSQGFRIPSVSEFFLGQSDSFPTVADPCVAFPAATKPGFCPPSAKQPNAQIRTTIGGNPAMTPERSISRTVGFVYSPDWLPGFDFSADYYKIDLLNAVSVIGAQVIMNGCYIGGNLNYCKLITRAGGTQGNYNTSGSITNILNVNVNIGGVKTEGVDVNTDYKFPSTAIGDFKASLNVTFVKQYVTTLPFGSGALSSQEMSGTTSQSTILVPFSTGASGVVGGIPKQRANFALNWNYGDWSAVWNVDYMSHLIEDCNALYGTAPAVAAQLIATRCTSQNFSFPFDGSAVVAVNHIGATTYHDVAVTYHADSIDTDFTFGIRNLFDKQPPIAMSAFANSFLPTLYRAPGRFFYARVGVKF